MGAFAWLLFAFGIYLIATDRMAAYARLWNERVAL